MTDKAPNGVGNPAFADLANIASVLVPNVQLLGIVLQGLTWNVNFDLGPLDEDSVVTTNVDTNAEFSGSRFDGGIQYAAVAKLNAIRTDGPTVFEATITFFVGYQLLDGFEPTQEVIDAFGLTSVAFAVHPYVREMVQSLTSRSGIPVFTLQTLTQSDYSPKANRS